jgi:5-methyltetrahydropteroyltriglutamate--homocysteine methyltransferase
MFATLVGAYPRTSLPGRPFKLRAAYGQLERGEIDATGFRGVQDELIREIIGEQEEAGLEPLTDGGVRAEDPLTYVARGLDGFEISGLLRYFDTNTYFRQPRAVGEPRWTRPITVDDWRFAASCAAKAVKQNVLGPYTLGRLSDAGEVGQERVTLAAAEALNQELHALADAGCPLIQVDEDGATLIGQDGEQQRLFREAQRRLLAGFGGAGDTHLSLAITMGNADAAGTDTLFDAPYSSYLFDLIAGPDNWRLIARAPGERGIICGALDARNTALDTKELLIWAAHYAASTGERGPARVGLSPSASLEYLPRDRALAKIKLLGEAARLAAMAPSEELARAIDPRAVDIRSAAFGRYAPTARKAAEEAQAAQPAEELA